VGPMRNGAPCRSTVANDPLEGIQVRICKRADAGKRAPRAPVNSARGPSFGRYRDTNGAIAEAAGMAHSAANTKPASKQIVSAARKTNGTLSSNQRVLARRS
ncbi:MAG TPA: hypothetical protein VKP66_14825, partial [Steroidobacteraceae bacterium]|nr:hypothetical protein [Steroidobacteraceae bacterium]